MTRRVSMSRFLALFLLAMNVRSFGQSPNREQLIRLLEGAWPSVDDVAFDYEGALTFPEPADKSFEHPKRLKGLQQTYTGTFIWRRDGARFLEMYHLPRDSSPAQHFRISTRDDVTEASLRRSDAARARITKARASSDQPPGPGDFRRIQLRDFFLGLLRSERIYEFDGIVDLEGRKCIRVRIFESRDPTAKREELPVNIFWIDMERGAHVLCHELWIGNNKFQASRKIELREFRTPAGEALWLPAAGRFETYITANPNVRDSPVVAVNEPVSLETYDLLENTVRIDKGIEDASFSIEAKPGDFVSDELKQAQYEYGQYLVRSKNEKAQPISDVEIQQNLDKMLQESKFLERELKASSPARSGPGWADLLPWGAAGAAFVTLIVVLVRRHVDS